MLHYLKDRSLLVASGLLLAQIGLYYGMPVKEQIPAVSPWSEFPNEFAAWRSVSETSIEPEVLATLQPDDYLQRTYVSTTRDAVVSFLIVYFRTRRSGHAPHSPQWCLPGSGWKDVSARVVTLAMPGQANPQPVNEYIVQKGTERLFVVYWYHQGSHAVANDVVAQLYALPEMIFHGRTDTALVRIIVPVAGEQTDRARADAFQFARDSFPLVHEQIH
jgi:EpsI family protein